MAFVIRLAITAVALWIATLIVSGIDVTARTTGGEVATVLVVALIFGIVNAVLKPIIRVVGCVFYLLTLGLFALVVNALLFMLTGWIAERTGLPFAVDGFWPAFWGAIIVAVVSWVISLVVPEPD
ncbi:phage holin family protein [Plantactinospora sp. GCM10030261]|uniref:phage holin family protein n=1 Tax=Plantactinospora sp. GCM10030261 TaxID=3273420 RepID=UPI003612A874